MTTLDTLRKALEALEKMRCWAEGEQVNYTGTHPVAVGREAITALRAEIARLEAAEPVAGWKMVPLEPTLEMLTAAGREDDAAFAGGSTHGARIDDVWAAMLDAAPTLPAAISWDAAMPPEVAQWLSAHPPTVIKPVAPPAAIPALNPIEYELVGELPDKTSWATIAHWAYALAAERAGVRIEE